MNENTPESTEPTTPAAEAAPAVEAPEAAEDSVTDAVPADAPAVTATATAADVGAQLKELFPALFTGGAKPLKLRIQADIQERAPGRFTKQQLSAFFRRYTGGTGYLIALTKAKERFDLDGQPAGEIAEEHLVAAREELARRKGLKQERMAAEQAEHQLLDQQRHNRAGLLRDFERTTLTLPNFCALKGVTAEELPGLLDIARKERAEQPPAPPRMAMDRRPPQREPREGREGREGRGGRSDARRPNDRRPSKPGGGGGKPQR
ncbi:ProQ/FinO family protein [Paucibacter sp. R3-3]|uniref:ProQ/FinO family protein n=1 Tax=Roseateles agri TaxID=3098619 RepID=A0ABU5DGZ2_9BURK|nr:ProQ/FinO family protein [Paucibacter sp. R3-3]MDY0744975.1 ProQ/FinO family protein [Paucibacter sp. R3-3]